ncbi:MAG: DUF4398 domain-containing protein [Leptospirales bacterium]
MNVSINRNRSRGLLAGLTLLSAITLGGCMSEGPVPDQSMTQAKMVLDQAMRAGTRNYAAFDLNNAQDKLKQAKEAMKKGNNKEAGYLAKEAKVDAELALAKTQKAKAKEAETQLEQSMQTLHGEVNSSTTPPE